MLKVDWANKHSMVEEHSSLRTSSDIPVVRLDELSRWLIEHEDATEDNGLHVCLDTLLAEIAKTRRA
jgi:hypothetical protein